MRRIGHLVVGLAVLALAGCTTHHAVSGHLDDSTLRTSAPPTSPYLLLADPGVAVKKPGEAPLGGGAGKGPSSFSLAELAPNASHLIVRWDCDGSGTFAYYLDGVMYSSSGCKTNVVDAADLPLKAAKLHPTMLTIKAPTDVYWKISISQVSDEAG